MKVLLCNDTGTKSHIGCQAVSNAHARMLGRLGHRVNARFFVNELSDGGHDRFADIVAGLERDERFSAALSEVDAVIVNGEGTIHHGGGLALLAALHIAKKKHKAALLVNCLFQDVPIDESIINSFDYFSVREPRSHAYAQSRDIRCVQRFDSIVAAQFAGKLNDLAGMVLVTDWAKSSDQRVGKPSTQVLLSHEFGARPVLFPIHGELAISNWSSSVSTLSTAKALVTSRHHGIYLAILAGIPFVALKGNTWKGEGLLESFNVKLPMVETYDQIKATLSNTSGLQRVVSEAQAKLFGAADLQHFAVLGTGSDSSEAEELTGLRSEIDSRVLLRRKDAQKILLRRQQEKDWQKRLRPEHSWLRRLFKE